VSLVGEKEIWGKKCGQQISRRNTEEDGGGSTGQSWMETSGLRPIFY